MADAKLTELADRWENLLNGQKEDIDILVSEANEAGVDVPGLRRLVSWRRADATKRAEREAIDEQYRFLTGETDEPAALPEDGHLAEACRYYADGLSVRQVAEVLKCSVGKAQKLRTLARAFAVHRGVNVHRNVNTPKMTAADLGTAEPVRDMVEDDLGDPMLILNPFRAKVRVLAAGVVRLSPLGPVLSGAPPDDDNPIPDFLRRPQPAQTEM